MRVDEAYVEREGWSEESESAEDYMGVKNGVIVWRAEWRVLWVAYD